MIYQYYQYLKLFKYQSLILINNLLLQRICLNIYFIFNLTFTQIHQNTSIFLEMIISYFDRRTTMNFLKY